jgi:hypothetical protein
VSESRIMTQPAASAHPLDDNAIGAALSRMGAIGAGERWRCRPLPGGVSSDIRLIELEGAVCLKRALPRLRTAQLWEAPVARNHYEFAWFREAGRICRDAVPPLIGEDREAGLFVMAYLDPALLRASARRQSYDRPAEQDHCHLRTQDQQAAPRQAANRDRRYARAQPGDPQPLSQRLHQAMCPRPADPAH